MVVKFAYFSSTKERKNIYKVIKTFCFLFSVIVAFFCFVYIWFFVEAFADRGMGVFVVVLGFCLDFYDSICLLVWFVLLFQAAILDLYVCCS